MPETQPTNIYTAGQRLLLYSVVSLIVCIELYSLPLFVMPRIYIPVFTYPALNLEPHIIVFLAVLSVFLILGAKFSHREKFSMGFLLMHFIFCGLFFIFLFYLSNEIPFNKPLPETNLLVRLIRPFYKAPVYLSTRFTLGYVTLFACCHACIFLSFFRVKHFIRKYILSGMLSLAIVAFLSKLAGKPIRWIFYSVAKRSVNKQLWGMASNIVMKIEVALLRFCGLNPVSGVNENGTPSISLGPFSAVIGYPCAGFEGMALFLIVLTFFSILNWKDINKKRVFIVGCFGTLIMYITNLLRIFILFLVGHFIDPEMAREAFHSFAGIVLYIIVIILIFLASYKWMFIKGKGSIVPQGRMSES